MTPARSNPTPRAQLARVVVAAGLAVVLGGAPALVWDLTSQAPRAEPRSGWPKPSPWLQAGKQMKDAVGGVARVYFPSTPAASVSSAEASVTPPTAPSPGVITIAPPPRTSLWHAPPVRPLAVE